MIQIRFNDESILLDNQYSLAELLIQKNYNETHFAVALNRKFIARNQYATTFFKDGDVIELVSPMQGG